VQGAGCRVKDVGFRVRMKASGLRAQGVGDTRVKVLGHRYLCAGAQVPKLLVDAALNPKP